MKKDEIIDEIAKLRSANNTGWMKLVKLAFKHAPQEAKAAMEEVVSYDAQINYWARRLVDQFGSES